MFRISRCAAGGLTYQIHQDSVSLDLSAWHGRKEPKIAPIDGGIRLVFDEYLSLIP